MSLFHFQNYPSAPLDEPGGHLGLGRNCAKVERQQENPSAGMCSDTAVGTDLMSSVGPSCGWLPRYRKKKH